MKKYTEHRALFVSVLMSILFLFTGGMLPVSAVSNIPNTGDESKLMIWLVVLAASVVGILVMLVIVFFRNRKKKGKHFR